jgi:hypothetical protein
VGTPGLIEEHTAVSCAESRRPQGGQAEAYEVERRSKMDHADSNGGQQQYNQIRLHVTGTARAQHLIAHITHHYTSMMLPECPTAKGEKGKMYEVERQNKMH